MSGIIANTSDVSWVAESGDCINRQDAINVAIQAADDWDGGYNPERAEMIERGLKMLPALQAESCEDAISREAVHEMLENIPINESDKWFNWLQKACLRLADLPSVAPNAEIEKEEPAEWIVDTEEMEENKMEKEDVLDKIRAEILENAFSVVNPKNTYEYINVLDLGNIEKIIDKYKVESEEE